MNLLGCILFVSFEYQIIRRAPGKSHIPDLRRIYYKTAPSDINIDILDCEFIKSKKISILNVAWLSPVTAFNILKSDI